MKQIQYEDQFLTLKNYKEPLKIIPTSEGHGFYGAILITVDGTKMQCHVCGKLWSDVGSHARQAHKITTKEYREKYQLAYTTALISEAERDSRKMRTVEFFAGLTEEQRREYKALAIKNYRKYIEEHGNNTAKSLTLEDKNKRGTCPDQLLEQIRTCQKELGKTPTKHEFIAWAGTQRYVHLIFKTFGSWTKAVEMAGFEPRKQPDQHNKPRYEYESEELLEYLRVFAQENQKIPTATDFRRDLLPSHDVYIRRFGSIEKARELAGVYNIISRHELSPGGYATRNNKLIEV